MQDVEGREIMEGRKKMERRNRKVEMAGYRRQEMEARKWTAEHGR